MQNGKLEKKISVALVASEEMANKDYRVSVIIPCYNQERYIDSCMASLEKQNFDGLEAIFVDDGSTDLTKDKILAHMDKKHNFDIVYLSQENGGPGVARNTGLDHAHGKYIAFHDSDDSLPFGAYEEFYYTAEKHNADIVIGEYMRRVDNGHFYIPDFIRGYCENNKGKNLAGDFIVVTRNPSLWNRMYSRDFLNSNNIRFLPELSGEDCVFNLDAVKYAERMYTTEALVYYYTKRTSAKNSLSTAWNERNTSSYIRSIKKYTMEFDKAGDVYAEYSYILNIGCAHLIIGIDSITDPVLQNDMFEMFKSEVLSAYSGNIRYSKLFEILLGIELDVVLSLPYRAYKSLLARVNQTKKPASAPASAVAKPVSSMVYLDLKEQTLQAFAEGEIGFKYIKKYFKAWLKYKLKKKK